MGALWEVEEVLVTVLAHVVASRGGYCFLHLSSQYLMTTEV
jgi:hypothetical protein